MEAGEARTRNQPGALLAPCPGNAMTPSQTDTDNSSSTRCERLKAAGCLGCIGGPLLCVGATWWYLHYWGQQSSMLFWALLGVFAVGAIMAVAGFLLLFMPTARDHQIGSPSREPPRGASSPGDRTNPPLHQQITALQSDAISSTVRPMTDTERDLAMGEAGLGEREYFQQDLASGLVQSIRVRPLDVIQIDFPPQREPSMLFRIAENQAIFIHLVDPHDPDSPRAETGYDRAGVLPNTDFEYLVLGLSRTEIGILSRGEPILQVKHLRDEDVPFDYGISDCVPFIVVWEELERHASVMRPTDSLYY